MRKLVLLVAFLGIFTGVTNVTAQEYNPMTDYLYTSANFNAYLKFDINDQLLNVYFTTGKTWLEYEIVEDNYLGPDKGWVYKIKDGMGNNYVITRTSLDGNLTISPIKGKIVTLVRKIY